MKPSFRQFIEDIDIDRHAYDPEDSSRAAYDVQKSTEKRPDSWKKLPIDFPVDGFEVWWGKYDGDLHICLVDVRKLDLDQLPFGINIGTFLRKSHRIAVDINVTPHHIKMFGGGKLMGLKTDVLSSHENYRGSGLAPMLYKALIDAGQVLFSSTTQTPGGQSTWRRLIKAVGTSADVGFIENGDEAMAILVKHGGNAHNMRLIHRLKGDDEKLNWRHFREDGDSPSFLFLGPVGALDKEVYDIYSTYWVIAPHGVLDRYEANGVHVDVNPKKAPDSIVDRQTSRRP